MVDLKEDNREITWADIEKDVQKRADNKDPDFVLDGEWKEFVREQDGLKVFSVDGTWIRNNLSIIFGHGGHGLVHEFIPMDEIWIARTHFEKCEHKGLDANSEVSQAYFDSCTIHEIKEFQEMEKGKLFWEAHQLAIIEEKKHGLISDEEIGN